MIKAICGQSIFIVSIHSYVFHGRFHKNGIINSKSINTYISQLVEDDKPNSFGLITGE